MKNISKRSILFPIAILFALFPSQELLLRFNLATGIIFYFLLPVISLSVSSFLISKNKKIGTFRLCFSTTILSCLIFLIILVIILMILPTMLNSNSQFIDLFLGAFILMIGIFYQRIITGFLLTIIFDLILKKKL